MFQKGDTLFDDSQRHGEPQLRAAMVHGGFNARKENVCTAFELGKSMAGLKGSKTRATRYRVARTFA